MAEPVFNKKEYLESNGEICPYCGSWRQVSGQMDYDDDGAWIDRWCEDCNKEWRDIYTLLDIEPIG